ncbi:UNVERIFIED_CONTAM: hypothetical protein PYX00_010993 [Menopon gallinae]|uniref:Uncharacterized protein n=1 Tax=Menopon gallinae TaxID=328185 RepID=A0AAW2H6V1_9NEOP
MSKFPYDKYPHVRANVYCGDSDWITNKTISEEAKRYHVLSSFKGKVGDLTNLNNYDNIIKIFFNVEKDQGNYQNAQKTIKEVEKYLLDRYCDETVITAPLPSILEVNSPKATKGQAMKKVMAEKGIALKDVIAFGDGFNDFDMLSSAGRGLIMGNAHYTLKEALPSLEIIETSDADGVAKYLVLNVLLDT